MRRGTIAVCAALSALVIAPGGASAETVKVDVTFTTKAGPSPGVTCVDEITVAPRKKTCPVDPDAHKKDVCIDPHKHWDRGGTKVKWILCAAEDHDFVDGAKLYVAWQQSDPPQYEYCPITKNLLKKKYFKPVFKCEVKNRNRDALGYWQYSISADDACDSATVDPQVIFVTGGGEPPG
jgi:hypothetical protein